MGGLLTALNAGKTSLSANQKSIEIVGNNIANVNTPGYSRQRAELTQIPAVNWGDFFIGQGVTVTDVQRDYDVFINRQLQEKNIDYGEELGKSNSLAELERIFSISEDNLASEIDRFFDAWQQLAANPSGLVERDTVIQRGQLLGDAFKNTYDELENVRQNINTSVLSKVDTINEQLQQIAELNDRIRQVETSGQTANAARDQRDLLIQDLSQTLGVQTYTDSQGMLAVQLPGGLPLVQGGQAMQLEAVMNGSDVNLQVNIAGSTQDIGLDQLGGEMKGLFYMRDEFIAGLRDDLDTLATEIANSVNQVHQSGTGLDGSTGLNFFLDPATLSSIEHPSRNLTVVLTDANQLAAGGPTDPPGTPAAPGDNTNALAMAALEREGLAGLNGDTYDAYFSKMVSSVGIEASRNDLALGGAEDALVQLQNLRDGYSGVSLDEEMIDLVQYQRGFESSAKFLSTIDEMMDSLLQLKR
ncbi:flagellar hook-associated protein 1 [Desulfolithobacter dissulfuricans]|uniref:Flagellar hook-associated protein 1 n=1 Tax=Desulfolithobacter dissulfuricans TaxID=2795293 RepID=A0A915TYW7_9BACT|nr:flagellar hook-associated protein FlgK [Desulfolithobacter dissulfuricans]BCO08513.1 flagellar hook-associated protein 1 [Desulfolithobacter dissulfuricans]